MAGFISNAITNRGRILLGEAQTGATFEATKIVMGSGHIPSGSSAATMTAVVTPVIELAINKKKRAGDGTVTFGGAFSNETITEAFYFREFALFARVQYADGTYSDEVLYSYGNAGGNADLIPAYSTSTIVEKQMDLVIWIGNETQVNLTVASGLYNAHAEKHAADGEDPITPAMIGAVPSRLLGSHGAETTIAAQVQYWFDRNIRWGIFHAALCSDLPPKTINWDHGVEFQVLSGYRVKVEATALNNKVFVRHYDAYTKEWINDWENSTAFDSEEIPDGADMNDYRKPGKFYKVAGASTLLNYPSPFGAFALEVERTGSYGVGITQTLKDHQGNIYVRAYAADNDHDWSRWDHILSSNGDSTIDGSLSVNYGSGTLKSWLVDTETGVAIETYRARKVGRVQVTVKDSGAEAHLVYFDDETGASETYLLYHTGNAPAVVATAEMV